MDTKFNVFETLEIAEKVERDGGAQYVNAAPKFRSRHLRDILYRLASWKGKHARSLANKRKLYSKKTGEFGRFDPNNYVLSNPRVMAALVMAMGKAQPLPCRQLTGSENQKDILKNAIAREREAVTFYRGLKAFAQDPTCESIVEDIIAEGTRHIADLTEMLGRAHMCFDGLNT